LATHTTVCSGILWYQIPRYLLLELPGQKNPSAKLFPLEIRRSPSLTVWFVFKESWDVQDDNWSIIREKQEQFFSFHDGVNWILASGKVLNFALWRMDMAFRQVSREVA
jgi:hypothetical protein